MTREELFKRYVEDTLDDDASAELEALLTDDPGFASQFAQDLIETGLFEEVDGVLQRVSPEDKDKDAQKDKDEGEETAVPGKPKPLKLITGDAEELPPSLQRLLPGYHPEPPQPEPASLVPSAQIAPPGAPPLAQPEPPVAEPPIAEPPIAEPPIAEPPVAEPPVAEPPVAEPPVAEPPIAGPPVAEPPIAEPPVARPPIAGPPPVGEQPVHPLASTLPPPAPPPPAARHPLRPQRGSAQDLFGHHEQPHLQSSEPRSPVAWISIAAVLLVGIGVALFIGLNKKAPPPPESEGIIGKVDLVDGSVTLTRDLKTEKLVAGMDLFEGDLISVQLGSARIAYVSEKTYLHLRTASEIAFGEHKDGKKIRLSLGEVTVEAAPQPTGRPMTIQTDNAGITLMGTRVTVRAKAKETLVEVSEGSVRVERRKDSEKVEVGRGAWALVSEDKPLQSWGFVTAVNLNGPETSIDGGAWLSYEAAKAKGMKVESIGTAPQGHTSTLQPQGYVPHAELRSILMSSVVARAAKLAIKWPQPNGRYQIFVWMMEDAGSNVRSIRLNVEEKLVGTDLGKEQVNGQWNRYGPFPAEVKDGVLDLLLSADHKLGNRDPHLAGIAIYSASGGAPAPPSNPGPPETPGVPPPPTNPGAPPGIQPTIP